MGEAVVGGWTPPENDRHRNEDEEGRQGVDEIGADRYLGILAKHLVLEEEDLVRDGQEGDDLRIEGGQTGGHGGVVGAVPAAWFDSFSPLHRVKRTRWLELPGRA